MEVFAIVILFLIIVILQHIANWGFRVIYKGGDGDLMAFYFLLGLFNILFVYICAKYIIEWSKLI